MGLLQGAAAHPASVPRDGGAWSCCEAPQHIQRLTPQDGGTRGLLHGDYLSKLLRRGGERELAAVCGDYLPSMRICLASNAVRHGRYLVAAADAQRRGMLDRCSNCFVRA